MKLGIQVRLDYQFDEPTDILLQLEAAHIPEQTVEFADIVIPPCEHFARVPAQDHIGERIWLRTTGQIIVAYNATVAIERILADWHRLEKVPAHRLPGETVSYLLASRYCPSDRFGSFVAAEFGGLEHGALILAMREWIHEHLNYVRVRAMP